ncbi:lactococcin 972-like bacteriocin [Saccharothrix saharensis]|uniref:Lactococcin 972-like bacteriocin n=1 Tax=Saccharothrix saharensis TaxID=571190 RepID=A0A543JCW1_9PSEU|nr:lactococcin 972 family bacteriocin [Saccharothrix saharensis]TQM80614.1 lactococcin 972-like bacteriocin [Saccharothrix saharensis]
MSFRNATVRLGAALGAAALAVVAVSTPAPAAPVPHGSSPGGHSGIRVVAQGQTVDGGWVEYTGAGAITVDGTSGEVGAQAVEKVGGGTWAYGATYNAGGRKVCYSQYEHLTVSHGSSVEMNGGYDSDWVRAGYVSYARLAEYTSATCKAYWRK